MNEPLAPQPSPLPTPGPAPITPRRPPSSHGVLIALLVLALIVVCAVAALIYGVRIISQNVSVRHEGQNQVSIKTPVGSIDVNQGAETDPALIGLPLYPGAQRVNDKDSANVNLDFPGGRNNQGVAVSVVAAKFETPDPLDKVAAYYRDQLSGQISKTTSSHAGQEIAFEIKRENLDKVVALKTTASGTEISLVRVRHGEDEAN
ncbi:MAG: hypothetical protein ACRD19_12555 [Terriglobia bacterium]